MDDYTCPYCLVEFNSKETFHTHKDICAFKDDPKDPENGEVEDSETEDQETGLEDLTVDELVGLCKETGISGYSDRNKDGLIELLSDEGVSMSEKTEEGE